MMGDPDISINQWYLHGAKNANMTITVGEEIHTRQNKVKSIKKK